MTTATAALRRNQNLTRTATQLQSGPITTTLLLIGLIIVLALLYLNQVTKTSTFNYRISNLTQKQQQLQGEKENLQIEAARLQSIQDVKSSNVAAKLAPSSGSVSFASSSQ